MTIDYTAWRFWVDIGQTAVTAAIGLYVWWDKRSLKTAARFAKIENWQAEKGPLIDAQQISNTERGESCTRHKGRTTALEKAQQAMQADLEHLPAREDLADLAKEIGRLTEKLATLDGRLTGINRAVDLLNQHHLRITE